MTMTKYQRCLRLSFVSVFQVHLETAMPIAVGEGTTQGA